MNRDKEFAKFITPIRKRAYEVGIAEVAAKTGLSRETIYRCVDARGNPRLTTLSAILKALDMHCNFGVGSQPRRNKRK